MAAATVDIRPDGLMAMEVAELTCSDGETYISGLSKPICASLTMAEAPAAANAGSAIYLNYALSGNTFTIGFKYNKTAVTDKKVLIQVFGRR